MKKPECAKAVMLAAIAAGGLIGAANTAVADVNTHPEVGLSTSVVSSGPLAYLRSITPSKLGSVNVDQGNMHVHINQDWVDSESGFEV
jgi:hypothetical protein